MSVFNVRSFKNHEMVVFCHDEETNLKAIIAIHNTNLGPSLGGCRMWPYENEEEAMIDALRLSRGMTYKSALANLNLGGGKSVIIGDSKKHKTPQLLKAVAGFVNRLNGQYIIAEDVGTSLEDMDYIHDFTKHVVGTTKGGSGDPSPATAYGTFVGIKACVEHKLGKSDLKGIRVAVQGLGHVGMYLCKNLYEAGCELWATDISAERCAEAQDKYKVKIVDPYAIYDLDVDVFAPCALGAIINDDTIPKLKAKIIAGSANNQLARNHHGDVLKAAGILYAPDYAINAGGLINVYHERYGYKRDAAYADISKIYDTLHEIFRDAEAHKLSTSAAADLVAEKRFKNVQVRHLNAV